MAVWLVRAGSRGEDEAFWLENGVAAIRFRSVPDLADAVNYEAVRDRVRAALPNEKPRAIGNYSGQLWSFSHLMAPGHIVALALKSRAQVALGRITGPYHYRPELPDMPHTRSVEWLRPDAPRTQFGQDLLLSLNAFMTVGRIQAEEADTRIAVMVGGSADPWLSGTVTGGATAKKAAGVPEPPPEHHVAALDVEELARDQIVQHLESHFQSHDLARLVDAILQAEGYVTLRSAPGPDGGVDVLARQGPLGLEGPRLCVQVKSGSTPVDVTVLRSLQGTMSTFKADHGLLVSWGGFNKSAESEARLSFFNVRLWGPTELLDVLLRNYDQLPEEIQSELPLKRVWALVREE